MLDYSIIKPEGILILRPDAPLSKGDFGRLTVAIDSYLADQGVLQGVLVVAKGFPGWENFGAFTAHMHFVREHEKKVRRVAVVTDSYFGGIAESLGKHFATAEIRHFPYSDEVKALDWLKAA